MTAPYARLAVIAAVAAAVACGDPASPTTPKMLRVNSVEKTFSIP